MFSQNGNTFESKIVQDYAYTLDIELGPYPLFKISGITQNALPTTSLHTSLGLKNVNKQKSIAFKGDLLVQQKIIFRL